DGAGGRGAAVGIDAGHAAALDPKRADAAPELVAQAAGGGGREPPQAHLLRVGEAAVRLVGRAGDAVGGELGLDLADLARLEEVRVETDPLEPGDVVAAGGRQPLGHGQQVAAAHVPGVGDADLVLPVGDRL